MVKMTPVLLLTLSLLLPTTASAFPFDEIVVFGDSLSDQGNLSTLTGGLIPPGNPAIRPFYVDGRFSNGPIWVDHLQSDDPGLSVTNFAVGGAFTGSFIDPADPTATPQKNSNVFTLFIF